MITDQEVREGHATAQDVLAAVKDKERGITRRTEPIYSETAPGKIVGYRLKRVQESKSTQRTEPTLKTEPINEIVVMRTCKKCGQEKSLTDFSKDRNAKDGIKPYCKSCMSTYCKKRTNDKSLKVKSVKPVKNNIKSQCEAVDVMSYNQKGFLLPTSIRSCAIYHAKIMDSGEYLFRIHDCVSGIRLRGDLNNPVEVTEAIAKLETLAAAAQQFANHIKTIKQ